MAAAFYNDNKLVHHYTLNKGMCKKTSHWTSEVIEIMFLSNMHHISQQYLKSEPLYQHKMYTSLLISSVVVQFDFKGGMMSTNPKHQFLRKNILKA